MSDSIDETALCVNIGVGVKDQPLSIKVDTAAAVIDLHHTIRVY